MTALPGRAEKDAALMRRVAVARDHTAFGEIAGHYGPRLKAWLVRRGEAAATAEDVVQDVLVLAWRKSTLFDPAKASLSTWLFRLTRNRWIDHRRKHDRMEPTKPETVAALIDAPTEGPDADFERRIAADAVRAELALLPPEQKQILHLAFFEGLSHSQIAERTGLALGTVKSRIRAPLKRLRESLKEFEESEE